MRFLMGQKIKNTEQTVKKAGEIISVFGMIVSVTEAILKTLNSKNN